MGVSSEMVVVGGKSDVAGEDPPGDQGAKMWIYNQQRAGRWEPSQQTVGSIFTTGGQNSLSSHGPASRYKEPAAATTPGLRMLLAGYISVTILWSDFTKKIHKWGLPVLQNQVITMG